MTITPSTGAPEKFSPVFERTLAPSITGNRGPLRFEEGTATETDVPQDFGIGAYRDTAGNRRGQPDAEMFYKHANVTMRERAHIGSASWIEAPEVLTEFVQGTQSGDQGSVEGGWERAFNDGGVQKRPSAVAVNG